MCWSGSRIGDLGAEVAVLVVAALGDHVAAGALLVAGAGAHGVRRPGSSRASQRLPRAAPAGPSAAQRRWLRASGRRAARQRATSAGIARRLRRAVGVAERDRRAGRQAQRRAEARTACRPFVPGAAAGAGRGSSRPAATAAGAARVPAPKKRAASVACPRTGPRSAAAKMPSGRRSASSAAWRSESVRRRASQRGTPSPRVRPVAGSHGFTPQYSNQVTERGRRERLRIVTSWSSSGSSPNGAYTCSSTASRPTRDLPARVARSRRRARCERRPDGRDRAC